MEKKGKASEVQSPGLSWELWNGMDGWNAQPLLMLPQTHMFVSMSRAGMLQLAAQYILQH